MLGVGMVIGAVAGGVLTKSRLALIPAGVVAIVIVGGIAFGGAPATDTEAPNTGPDGPSTWLECADQAYDDVRFDGDEFRFMYDLAACDRMFPVAEEAAGP